VLQRERSFAGADGQFDRELFLQFVKAIPQDNSGNLNTYWRYLENTMKFEQMLTKYISLLAKSTVQNPVEMRRSIEDNNITSDVSFIIQPYGLTPDSTVTVSKQEIKDYYNKNRKNFEQKASRDIEYVVFEVIPSEKDIELAKQDIEKVFEEFSTTSNLRSFLGKNSDKPLDTRFYKEGELSEISPVLDSFAFKANPASVLPLFRENYAFRSARINAVKMLPDSVFVQHILIQGSDRAKNTKLVDSLMQELKKGADFSALATSYSADRNPNVASPGDIGWMTQMMMVPGFDTCFVINPGTPVTVETNYGLHIVKVKERTKLLKKVQLAVLEKEAVASKETYNSYFTRAGELSSKAEGNFEKFSQAVKEMNLPVIPANGIEEGAKTVATYRNAREISRWAYEAEKGDVSQTIQVDNKYFFVVALTGVYEEGIPPVTALESKIEDILKTEKSNAKMVESVKEKVAGMTSLEEMASALNSMVSKQSGVSFGSLGSQAFDLRFVGAVSGATENTITGPVGGNVGVYIFRVDSRETGGFFTEDDAKARSMQLFSYQMQMLLPTMEKLASVKDTRAKFF
ncbi:MAG: peptidylprolyl isomerase, partial [Bacteroidales bacterium]|nr:peptidylprolyl isomerase [Bacteroidales bacterium]